MSAYTRQIWRESSNNPKNPNKNICCLYVAHYLGVHNATKYLHTLDDLIRASRTRWTIRSRKSRLNCASVGKARQSIKRYIKRDNQVLGFIVAVRGHVLLLNYEGKTIVDTDSRKRDNRPIVEIYGIYHNMHLGPFNLKRYKEYFSGKE